MARPRGSATIEIDSSTPTTGTPMAIGEPEPDRGPDRRAPGPRDRVGAARRHEEERAAEQEGRHRQRDPEHDEADRTEVAERESVAGAVDVARHRRALGDHGRVARHHVTADRSGRGDDDAAVQRGDVVVDPAVDDHVTVEREHPVLRRRR